MILADKRDYMRGYQKHYAAYSKLSIDKSADRSRRLLLDYCVECGLKYLLLDKWHEDNPKVIINNKDDKRNGVIKTHNLEKILKELGQTGTFRFPQIATAHRENITSDNFHELCRYGIRIKDSDKDKEEQYEIELKKIADWIREGMR